MDWIKVEKSTARKPEVLLISELLSIHPDHALGLCIRFWSWCDDQLVNGHAPSVTNVTLDATVNHTGFATALISAGWLNVKNGMIEVPNFDRHLSRSAKARALSTERKQRERRRNVTQMSRTQRDNSVTREEKRREDSNKPPIVPQGTTDLNGQSSTSPKGIASRKKSSKHELKYHPNFEKWWAVYPRKVQKRAAFKAWVAAKSRLAESHPDWTDEQIRIHLGVSAQSFAKSPAGQAGAYTPYPATWLNADQFDDDQGAWDRADEATPSPEEVDEPYEEH